jgi:hypothetical protein
MTKTNTAVSNDTAPGSSVEEHRLALAALQAELETVRVDADTARRNGETTEWMRLLQREADLPTEIEAARGILLSVQLEEAWVAVERCDATEALALVDLTAAQAAQEEHRRAVGGPKNTTAEAVAVNAQAAARLWDAYAAAKITHRVAEHATALALAKVDTIEDAIEAATAERPPAGEGLRRPVGRLRVTFVTHHPASYDPLISGSPSLQGATTLTFLAGTIPPRWAARQMTAPGVWEAAQ